MEFYASPLGKNICFVIGKCLLLKFQVNSFGGATFSYLAVQPAFDNNFHWFTLGNQLLVSLGENVPFPVLCAANIRCQEYQTCIDTTLSPFQHTLVEQSLGDTFLVPREIHVRQGQDSNHRPLDLPSNALPLDHSIPFYWQ